MAKSNKKFGAKRVWLNTDQRALASVSWSVDWHKYDKDPSVDGDLVIRDCSRTVSLEFYGGPKEYDEKLKKLDKLLKEVTNFRAALVEAMEYDPEED